MLIFNLIRVFFFFLLLYRYFMNINKKIVDLYDSYTFVFKIKNLMLMTKIIYCSKTIIEEWLKTHSGLKIRAWPIHLTVQIL